MDLNQSIFKAPSIPKLSKRTVSSPVLSGALKPQLKLKKTTFSFIKPIRSAIDTEKISQPIVIQNNNLIGQELEETNKILVEIQKQLEIDFQSRIDEEKKLISAKKKRISRKKIADKEEKLEKGGKGILGKTFEKVTAPFKSIFQKLIDFFSIILTGILLNTAFKWLSDKNNRKKLDQFFNFIKDYWQELLIIFAAWKLRKLVGAVFGIALKLKKLVSWFKNRFGSKPKPSPKIPGGSPELSPRRVGRLTSSYDKFISGKSNIIDRARLIKRGFIKPTQIFSKGGVEALRGTVKTAPKSAPISKMGIGGGPQALILNFLAGEAIGRMSGFVGEKFEEFELNKSIERINSLPQDEREEVIARIKKKLKEEKQWMSGFGAIYNAIVGVGGLSGETIDQREIRKKENLLNALGEKFSLGGTVGKGDRPGIDTTPAQTRGGEKVLLNEGEEVIRTSSSMQFRPLLKDINDNAGRLWLQFSEGIKVQDANTTTQFKLTKKFGDVIKQFKDYIESEIQKSKAKNFSGGETPPPAPILPPPPAPESTTTSPTPPALPTPPKPNEAQQGSAKNKQTSIVQKPPTITSSKLTGRSETSTTSTTNQINPAKTPSMQTWEKNYRNLADVNAERDRTRGTNEKTNPFMKKTFGNEYVSKLPAPETPSYFKNVFVKNNVGTEKYTKLYKDQQQNANDKTTFVSLPPLTSNVPISEPSGKTTGEGTGVPFILPKDLNSYDAISAKYYGIIDQDFEEHVF